MVLSVVAQGAGGEAPIRLILDTDMDSDCDDVGALAMLHAMADAGEVNLLGIVVSSYHAWSAPCTDAINTWYGRPGIPIGSPKGAAAQATSKFAKIVAELLPHKIRTAQQAEDAVALYRRLLFAQPDHSVVIVTIGDLTNIADLLKSPAAGDQPDGVTLVKQKVRLWTCMGGNFIGKPAHDDLKLSNNNFTGDKVGSLYAIQHWPTRLVFVGREIGSVPSGLRVGARLKGLPADHPVRVAYEAYFGGEAKDRHVADQTAVLFAVRGLRDYWNIETKGFMDLQSDMTFTWNYATDRHEYLLNRTIAGKSNDRTIEAVIEGLMMHQPITSK
jgi:Inosine-uridine preferring nucleoside hydrolase